MDLDDKGADAFASPVDGSKCVVPQGILDSTDSSLKEVPCGDAFLGSYDGTGMVNGLEEGFHGEAFARCFCAMKNEVWWTGKVGLSDS